MILVTGGAGFIGSNLTKALGRVGVADVVVADDLREGGKFRNLVDCDIADFWSKEFLLEHLTANRELSEPVEFVFHQGACSDTTEWDGRYMMEANFEFSKLLLNYCVAREIPFIYASSAAVYGTGPVFREEEQFECPLNVYAYSKCLFDRYVRRRLPGAKSQIVGLRYFNVYGPREGHKGNMSSVALQLRQQLRQDGRLRLFEGSAAYGPGEQRRDFIHVDDVVAVNLWFMDNPEHCGIFNVGTGRSQTFNDVANAVISHHGRGEVEYVAFPEHLLGHYQSFTEADIDLLRECGYERAFLSVEEGTARYMQTLDEIESSRPAVC